jgi:hypothetical protein
MERCRREISGIEAEILAGNPDLAGLCLGLSDWHAELRLLQDEERRIALAQRRAVDGMGASQAVTE